MYAEIVSLGDLLIKMGAGGAAMWFALQMYQKTLGFLATRKKESTSSDAAGDQPKEFWMKTFQDIVSDVVSKNVHTFAAQPDSYWRNMDSTLDKSVAKPITTILDKQTEILSRLAEYAAEERGAERVKSRK